MTDNKFSIRRTLPSWLSGLWGKIAVYANLWIPFGWGAARGKVGVEANWTRKPVPYLPCA